MTKSARKSPRNEVEIVAPATRQLTMPLPELLHEELYGAVTRLGLVALSALLQQEVEELCGPRYARGMGDRPSRNGTTAGSLALGGRRVEVQRPRVRKDGKEVNLATWDRLASEYPLNRLSRGLLKIAQRHEALTRPSRPRQWVDRVERRGCEGRSRRLRAECSIKTAPRRDKSRRIVDASSRGATSHSDDLAERVSTAEEDYERLRASA